MVVENWASTCKRITLDPNLPPYTKISSKGITDLNIKAETIEHLEKNAGVNPHDLGLSNEFLYMTPKAQETTTKNR